MENEQIMEDDREVLRCPVCWEDYAQSGELVPRIFPCTHSTCHRCVEGLFQWPNVRCPKCRAVHRAMDGVKTFPENQYILSLLKFLEKKDTQEFERCPEHFRHLCLYCKKDGCKKDICHLCLLNEHKSHDVVDILNDKMGKLKDRLEVLEKERFTEQLIYKISKESLEQLLTRKAEMDKKFDEMIETTRSQMMKAEKNVHVTESQIETLFKIKVKINKVHKANRVELESIEHLSCSPSKQVTTVCNSYEGNENQTNLYGKLVWKNIGLPKFTVTSKFCMPPNRQVLQIQEISDGSLGIYSRVTTYGNEQTSGFFLSRYKLETKLLFESTAEWKQLLEIPLDHNLIDMREVTLNEKQCLALCFSEQKKLEFRDLRDWKKMILTFCNEPRVPMKICRMSPSILLYMDTSQTLPEINGLDCSGSAITETDLKVHLSEGLKKVTSMLHTKTGGMELVFLVNENVLEAYDVNSDRLVWSQSGTLPGMEHKMSARQIATDGRGHLFVTDTKNDCIQMFSTDGRYFGAVLKDQNFGKPWMISWIQKSSSMLLNHAADGKEFINVIKVEL